MLKYLGCVCGIERKISCVVAMPVVLLRVNLAVSRLAGIACTYCIPKNHSLHGGGGEVYKTPRTSHKCRVRAKWEEIG